MILSLIPHDPPRRDLNASYKLRVRFWITSVSAHILWVAVAVRIPLSTPDSKRPIYDQFIRPLQSKVLVYRPPKKPAQAAPETQVGKSKEARGTFLAPRTAIATAKKAPSQKQIIWKPANVPELTIDSPAPTVVARIETTLPPPPPKASPKQFTPPELANSSTKPAPIEIAATLAAAPTIAVTSPTNAAAKALLPPPPKIPPKQFTPPTQSQQQPKLPTKTEVSELLAAAGPLTVTQQGLATASSTAPLPKLAPKQFTPPQQSAPLKQPTKTDVTETLTAVQQVNSGSVAGAPSLSSFSRLPAPPKDAAIAPEITRGNEQINLAIASVNPAPAADVPLGSRAGQFSVAPKVGNTATGEAASGALTIPDVTVRDAKPTPKPGSGKSNTLIYTERVRPSYSNVFTVPLRPANRSLPKAVEAYFAGRSVYAVVIPIENLPAYGTDWILWFAESTPPAGAAPSVRPPVPVRKIELVENSREPRDTRLQIAATLSSDGKLSNVKVLSAVSDAVKTLAMEDLSAWEWKPATRSNAAIAVEAVFEIPFRLALRP